MEKRETPFKTGKDDWAVFLNSEPALGQPSYGFATLYKDITFGDEYKTGHEDEGWRKEKLR
jgi:hypothetical protein